MSSNSEDIIGENGKSLRDEWNETGNDMYLSENDIALFKMTGSYIRALSDIEEVMNDPSLDDAKREAGKMVSEFKGRAEKLRANEKFITDILSETDENRNIVDEIRNIKLEINEKQISELTADWVKEWHEKRHLSAAKDEKKNEISNFIKSSLEQDGPVNEDNYHTSIVDRQISEKRENEKHARKIPIRFIAFSAAAALALIIVIKSLIPYPGPDKLFTSYFEPFEIVSPVTRSAANERNLLYDAVSKYKVGNYKGAAASFADIMAGDTNQIAPRFYFAMSQIAAGEYEQAINFLVPVVKNGGEYCKEAEWYLGLAYIKTGNKIKARNCFESLSQSEGYYSERSEKLLRRLK
jgi:TolA-binding protein